MGRQKYNNGRLTTTYSVDSIMYDSQFCKSVAPKQGFVLVVDTIMEQMLLLAALLPEARRLPEAKHRASGRQH